MSQETSEKPLDTETYRKNAAAQIEPQNADTHFARACAIEMHFNISQGAPEGSSFWGNLQQKCRGLDWAQNADTYFARACAVETHVNISQETLEDPP